MNFCQKNSNITNNKMMHSVPKHYRELCVPIVHDTSIQLGTRGLSVSQTSASPNPMPP